MDICHHSISCASSLTLLPSPCHLQTPSLYKASSFSPSSFPLHHHALGRYKSLVCFNSQDGGGMQPYPEAEAEGQLAILMEIEGVVADIHRFGHRHAFNVAFQKLGLDCANWTEPVYSDLLRQAGGDEERMLSTFFERIGWPTTLPTGEKDAFVKNLIQEKQLALGDRVASGSLSLRPGIESFVDEVIEAHIPLVIIITYNKCGEIVSRSLVEKLGPKRARQITMVGKDEIENSAYGQVVLGAGTWSDTDEQLAFEAARGVAMEKQRIAKEVASILNLSNAIDRREVDFSRKAIAALRAAAEAAGVGARHCVLITGSQIGVEAANRIGMPCIAVRCSLTARGEFSGARAVLDDFGAGSLTLPRLRRLLRA